MGDTYPILERICNIGLILSTLSQQCPNIRHLCQPILVRTRMPIPVTDTRPILVYWYGHPWLNSQPILQSIAAIFQYWCNTHNQLRFISTGEVNKTKSLINNRKIDEFQNVNLSYISKEIKHVKDLGTWVCKLWYGNWSTLNIAFLSIFSLMLDENKWATLARYWVRIRNIGLIANMAQYQI